MIIAKNNSTSSSGGYVRAPLIEFPINETQTPEDSSLGSGMESI